MKNLLEVPCDSLHTRQAFEHAPLQAVKGLPSESLPSEERMGTSVLSAREANKINNKKSFNRKEKEERSK